MQNVILKEEYIESDLECPKYMYMKQKLFNFTFLLEKVGRTLE